MPRYTEIEWRIFDEAGITKVRRGGRIKFDIDAPIAGVNEDCVLEIWVGQHWYQFSLDLGPVPEAAEQGMFIKIKTKEETKKLTPKPLPAKAIKPTPAPEPEMVEIYEVHEEEGYIAVARSMPQNQNQSQSQKPKPRQPMPTHTPISAIDIFAGAATAIVFLKKRKKLQA